MASMSGDSCVLLGGASDGLCQGTICCLEGLLSKRLSAWDHLAAPPPSGCGAPPQGPHGCDPPHGGGTDCRRGGGKGLSLPNEPQGRSLPSG
mmetsp:Transcript_3430/g.11349  ORF Transcript_3430/g.11349 Transcript_3430/m.11349 type:complete len:92 (-) Transcript_3430:143-418(-)